MKVEKMWMVIQSIGRQQGQTLNITDVRMIASIKDGIRVKIMGLKEEERRNWTKVNVFTHE